MKETKDNFSEQAAGYAKFRPVYPTELYDAVLQHVNERGTCWDCATGNGQIATVMSKEFTQVIATDISEKQLQNAPRIPNVVYRVSRAEASGLDNNAVDLTMVGQAVHWFDHEHVNKELVRVSKPNAVVAFIGYGLMYADANFNSALSTFYTDVVGPYWDPERRHIDSGYASIPFPFDPIELGSTFSIDVTWSLSALEGYLKTWSSVRRYIRQHGTDPVDPFIQSLVANNVWTSNEKKAVSFPLFVKVGSVNK